MQVHDLLLQTAAVTPERNFIFDRGSWYTYRDVEGVARRLAFVLHDDVGLPRGGRVALLWDNGVEAAASLFGILIAGGVMVPLNTEFRGESLSYLLEHSDAEALIVSRKLLPRVLGIMGDLSQLRTVITDASPGALADVADVSVFSWTDIRDSSKELSWPVRTVDIDLAALIYTSGSTGLPKGVMLTHLNLVSNMRSIVEYLHMTGDDSMMVILPLFYIYGLSLLLTHAMVGGSLVFDNRFMYPNTVLEHMVERGVTGFAGVPSTFSMLLSRSSVREMSFPSLRYVTQAGGAMPVAVQKNAAAVFAPADLYIMYGATEAAPRLSYVEPGDLPRKWGSIGKPVPNVDLFVADGDGHRLPPGTEGELVARGSNITRGYWKDEAATAAVLRDGLYYTGDLGTEDEDGFLYVTGRSKDIMKIKGYRVSPREIEECLAQVPGVSEASVIGVPDEILGEAPVAYVVRDGDGSLSAAELKQHLRAHLAPYKVPADFRFPGELPKSGAGKVLKTVLREQYAGGTE